MKKLGIGIIGCGTILPVHLDGIHSYEEAELLLVSDIEATVAKSVADREGCQWVADYKEVLGREAIDVVHILTPHYLHVPMAIEALEAGKHVVLEKPVGISYEQLIHLQEVAERSGLVVGVTFQNRFNPTTLKMREIVESGRLGKLIASKAVLTWCRKDAYYSDSKWRGKLSTEGGGLLINQAIHTLDLLEYIGGRVGSIEATVLNNTHPDIEVEDTAMILMRYESGAVANFFATNSHGEDSPIEMDFIYEKGKMQLRKQQLTLTVNDQSDVVASDLVKKGEKSYWGMSHQLIIGDIYQSIRADQTPTVTLEEAIRATELVLACYK